MGKNTKSFIAIMILIVLVGGYVMLSGNQIFSITDLVSGSTTFRGGPFSTAKINFNNVGVYNEEYPTISSYVNYNSYDDICSGSDWFLSVRKFTLDGETISQSWFNAEIGRKRRNANLGLGGINVITENVVSGKHEVCGYFGFSPYDLENEYDYKHIGAIQGKNAYLSRMEEYKYPIWNYITGSMGGNQQSLLSTEYCSVGSIKEKDCSGCSSSDCETSRTHQFDVYTCDFQKKWGNEEVAEHIWANEPTSIGGLPFKYYKSCIDVFVIKESDIEIIKNSDVQKAELLIAIGQIENLNATLEMKKSIVAVYEGEIEIQADLIKQLSSTSDEQVLIIKDLNLKVEDQGRMIIKLTDISEEQALYIQQLDLSIQQQADLINQMTDNLEKKIAMVNALNVENEVQAELIKAMRVSFGNQIAIIDGLDNTIKDDARIIGELYDNLEDQGVVISELKRTNEEKAEIIQEMDLNLDDQLELIARLQITNSAKEQMLKDLAGSLEREQQINNRYSEIINEKNIEVESLEFQVNVFRNTTFALAGIVLLLTFGFVTFFILRKK